MDGQLLCDVDSPDQSSRLDVLDTMDELRSLGVAHFIDLPQIVVCGDQSSGKSSVLEALSGINFPRHDNLCTRFATEVIIRRNRDSSCNVSIVPHQSRSQDEQQILREFAGSKGPNLDLQDTIESAKSIMGIDNTCKRFSHDILRIEITGPSQPHLTLVDLPGLFWAGTKTQSDDDAESVKALVLKYMKNKRSIILTVVSAKNDIANQIVTKYATQEDPAGLRTLGILTKPDTLHEGSESEQSFLELAENKNISFRHGWHVMVNRDFGTREATIEERNVAEQKFLEKGVWSLLPRRQKGVEALKPRLSSLLQQQIIAELPHLHREVEQCWSQAKSRVQKMGDPRASLQAQRMYLLNVSHQFGELLGASLDGNYNDEFFDDPCTANGFAKRLRAVIQHLSTEFAKTMREKGHARHIIDGAISDEQRQKDNRLHSRDEYVDHILDVMRRSRGRELPGTYNPLIIGDLFREQCEPWERIIKEHCQKVWQATMHTLNLIIDHCVDLQTATKVKSNVIGPHTSELKTRLYDEAEELIRPHRSGHPITYNHYFTDNLHRIKMERHRKQLRQVADAILGSTNKDDIDVTSLINRLTDSAIADMGRYACSELVDSVRAYYKVALKTVVDEVSTLCVERRLLNQTPSVFTPRSVISMSDELVERIAADSPESVMEREAEMRKSKILEKAYHKLQGLYEQEADHIESEICDISLTKPLETPLAFRSDCSSPVQLTPEPIPEPHKTSVGKALEAKQRTAIANSNLAAKEPTLEDEWGFLTTPGPKQKRQKKKVNGWID